MDFDQRLSLLRERYRASLQGKRDMLQDAWRQFHDHPRDGHLREQLRSLLHRLAGSAPAYGYAQLGEVASIVSQRLGNEHEGSSIDVEGIVDEIAPRIDELVLLFAESIDETPSHEDHSSLRVILVEDDEDQALAIELGLKRYGCEVAHVTHAESFWQKAATWPCDAVVVDYWLDKQTAHDILDLVRSEPTFAHVAMVCLTAEDDEAIRQGVLQRGCDACMQKRDAPRQLYGTLRTHVDARRTH